MPSEESILTRMRSAHRARCRVGYQRWRDLLFLHWPIPDEAVRTLVPPELELDLFEGRAYVTLIPFVIAEARLVGVPKAFAIRLLETNLRTYVRAADGEAGVYFFSLEASSLLAVAAARILYGLPYFPAVMRMRKEGTRVIYSSRRRTVRGPELATTYSVGELTGVAAAGTRDHFLVERYSLYVSRARTIYRAQVRHGAYPLHRVSLDRLSQSLLAAAGLPSPNDMPLCHYSPGVDVEIFFLERVTTDHSH